MRNKGLLPDMVDVRLICPRGMLSILPLIIALKRATISGGNAASSDEFERIWASRLETAPDTLESNSEGFLSHSGQSPKYTVSQFEADLVLENIDSSLVNRLRELENFVTSYQ
ncbi:hypothetical protein RCL1_000532 [Eukaryota sp. TZLM3-RCL]